LDGVGIFVAEKWVDSVVSVERHSKRVLNLRMVMMSGVVQGSGIGPVSLLIYVNDLAKLLERHGIVVKLFADDVKVYMEVVNCDDAKKMQCALDLISKWAEEWQLSVSVSKCNLLTLGRSLAYGKYYISDNQLPSCTQSRDLGIIINSDLTPADHIQQITVKAYANRRWGNPAGMQHNPVLGHRVV